MGDTEIEPEVPLALNPDPVQEVAFVLLQLRVDDWPLVIEAGFAVIVAVGGGFPDPGV